MSARRRCLPHGREPRPEPGRPPPPRPGPGASGWRSAPRRWGRTRTGARPVPKRSPRRGPVLGGRSGPRAARRSAVRPRVRARPRTGSAARTTARPRTLPAPPEAPAGTGRPKAGRRPTAPPTAPQPRVPGPGDPRASDRSLAAAGHPIVLRTVGRRTSSLGPGRPAALPGPVVRRRTAGHRRGEVAPAMSGLLRCHRSTWAPMRTQARSTGSSDRLLQPWWVAFWTTTSPACKRVSAPSSRRSQSSPLRTKM